MRRIFIKSRSNNEYRRRETTGKQGDREGAIALLRQMLEQNEGERELVLLELGVVYNAMGETTQAINHLNEVMRINPENAKAKAYLEMINGILNYYCKDLLNP